MKRYKAAQEALRAQTTEDDEGRQGRQGELDALVLFKGDMGAFVRLYTFLSQIFDYGNTAIEKRAIFYKRLLPLLEFGREREGIDLSKVKLTHHTLRRARQASMRSATARSPSSIP
jgi:type I restriction enzyme R subunit